MNQIVKKFKVDLTVSEDCSESTLKIALYGSQDLVIKVYESIHKTVEEYRKRHEKR